MPPTLTIWSTPYKPSKLSVTSPAFPRSPISPLLTTTFRKPAGYGTASNTRPLRSPPPTPVAWTWECHKCLRRWPLGVTRRCLIDGHWFCSGENERSRLRNKARRACRSKFSYGVWHTRNIWRRRELEDRGVIAPDPEHRDCWYWCDYPSQCSWEPTRQQQIVTATTGSSASRRPAGMDFWERLFLSMRQRRPTTYTEHEG
jgi:hypothetical protein